MAENQRIRTIQCTAPGRSGPSVLEGLIAIQYDSEMSLLGAGIVSKQAVFIMGILIIGNYARGLSIHSNIHRTPASGQMTWRPSYQGEMEGTFEAVFECVVARNTSKFVE